MQGIIRRLDVANRMLVVEAGDGKELTVRLPVDASIDVVEHETMGTMGGDMEDLEVGYLVEVDIGHEHEDGTCTCASLECVS